MASPSASASRRSGIDHFPSHAAVDDEVRAGDEARFRRQQEARERSDVLRLADAPCRMLLVVLRRELRWMALAAALPFVRRDPAGLMQFTRTSGPRLIASAWVSATTP